MCVDHACSLRHFVSVYSIIDAMKTPGKMATHDLHDGFDFNNFVKLLFKCIMLCVISCLNNEIYSL
jgi:hypothetical protein